MFVACKEYDTDLDVISSKDEFNSFKICVPRKVEPGTLKVFDIWQADPETKVRGFGDKMHILSIRDEEFFFDVVYPLEQVQQCIREPDEEFSEDELSLPISLMFSKYRGFSCSWPYFAF